MSHAPHRGPDADAVRARVDCRDLAVELGVRVKRQAGAWWDAHCFDGDAHAHGDRNPSLRIGREGWRCHGCGASGDAFDLVEALRGVDFVEALRYLAARVGLEDGGAWTPPPRPAAVDTPPPRPAPGALAVELWRIVGRLGLTDAASAWLVEARGLPPGAAHALGWRDWWPARHELGDLVAGRDPAELHAAGLANEDGRLWWPLRAMLEDREALRGVAVPVWLPGDPAPVRWRWRFYVPARVQGRRVKTAAQPGGGPSWVGGALPPGGVDLGRLGEARVVIIGEGEPDWLALAAVARERAAVVSLCAVSSGLPAELVPHLVAARRVVVAVHDGTPDRDGVTHGERVAAAVARVRVEAHGRSGSRGDLRHLFAESEDAADLYQRGALGARVNTWLEGVA